MHFFSRFCIITQEVFMRNYQKRVTDQLLELKLESFGATLIVGPKGCGKTTTAKQFSKSFVEFHDEDTRDQLLAVANTQPSRLLIGEKPRLFDEWQDAPKIWGAVRKSVDDEQENGLYILTGSTSHKLDTPHTGTQRISTLKMYPMSLYESKESNGSVSLKELFENPDSFEGCKSDLSMDMLIHAICRGGWPRAINNKTKRSQLEVAKDVFLQICERDISHIDQVTRNPERAKRILLSHARNICTLASASTILADIVATTNISSTTYYEYVSALERLFVLEDVEAWNPAIRSKTAIRSSKKINFVDPSIAVVALGISPEYFNQDFQTLGFLFESLCIRDLKIYSSALSGTVSYYRDRYDLEADAVLHLEGGRYALIEFKLGSKQIEEGAAHLTQIEELVKKYREKNPKSHLRLPSLKIVLTATEYGYRREDGVFVIPVGCLKD